MARSDLVTFILTHGRPDNVRTWKSLRGAGYTGRIFIVIDDEDKRGEEYKTTFGAENVLTFNKKDIASRFDEGDNFEDRRSVFYARNACWDLARKLGVKYFFQLDDDYFAWFYRYTDDGRYGSWRIRKTMDALLDEMIAFFDKTGALTVAISQGGDHIGGRNERLRLKRKAMNTFLCSVERPFDFVGRINEDVNTYVLASQRGNSMFTFMQAQVCQVMTQQKSGGMTELYKDGGTFLKTFYSVMMAPSCVRVGELSDPRSPHIRIHHVIDWSKCAVQIIDERHRKP